ncbi:1-aminocyclopropane-1-carboxylate synthase-like protein 1 [Hydractinia symbiolongicarpus]|uniref:1-aminocyclopropane-1-carboxylate synthase-like protein 1 n=1 Tax=Hydractinia symbiolongicarpus TaxID=13093 RepID=UPI002549FCDE|nr:1-aminocyclopropane-1-carboxylate synthase-like protein 1 [Hydractinia symbiolongicarpus]
MLSKRAEKSLGMPNLLYTSWKKQQDNPYDAEANPTGIINLGTAENNIIYDIINKKLSEINLGKMEESYTHYCKFTGMDVFRTSLSRFFQMFMSPRVSVTPDEIFVTNGGGVAIETLGQILCDEGEGVLTPAPYYKAFKTDLEQRFATRLCPFHFSDDFKITMKDLKAIHQKVTERGIKIKALLISHPINPLGSFYTKEQLLMLLEYCWSSQIHLICDEIYMLSVYDDKHMSFVNLLGIHNIHKYLNIIHIVWSFSKTFALSGFRCGVIITFNALVQKALLSLSYYTTSSTLTQYVVQEMISDLDWVKVLKSTTQNRLLRSRGLVVARLNEMNIPYILPTSGMFIVFNISKFLREKTEKAELELFDRFMKHGVYVVPGTNLEFSEPGWFRLIISNKLEIIEVGISRIIDALNCND